MNKRLFQACLLLILATPLILSSCSDKVGTPTGPTSGTGMISGTVLDSVTHAPIPGALVALYSASDTVVRDSVLTDASGRFSLTEISPRAYFLVALMDSGYNAYVENLTIQAGSNLQRTIYLSHYSHTGTQPSVAFHVENAVTGKPVTTATVDGAPVDASGNSLWYSNSSGQAIYTILAPGYDSVTASVYLIQGEEIFDTIYLVPHFDTLLARYTFNNSAVDSSGKGHDGTVHGGTFVYDRFGNATSALQFNGTTDYVSIPTAADLNFGNSESFTFCLWVKCQIQNSSSNTHYLLNKIDNSTGSDFGYSAIDNGATFTAYAGTTAGNIQTQGDASGEDNFWHFLTFIFDASGTTNFYYDGSPIAYDTRTDVSIARALRGPMPDSSPLLIGGDGTSTDAFKGIIDDVRIYRGTLLPSEIDSLYHENGW